MRKAIRSTISSIDIPAEAMTRSPSCYLQGQVQLSLVHWQFLHVHGLLHLSQPLFWFILMLMINGKKCVKCKRVFWSWVWSWQVFELKSLHTNPCSFYTLLPSLRSGHHTLTSCANKPPLLISFTQCSLDRSSGNRVLGVRKLLAVRHHIDPLPWFPPITLSLLDILVSLKSRNDHHW